MQPTMKHPYTKKDLDIIELLLEDSRMSQTKMAKRLNMPLSTLQKRLSRIQRELVDKFTIIVDPKKLGLGTYILRITCDVPHINNVVNHLKEKPYINDVYYREDGEIIAKAICNHTKFMDTYTDIMNEFHGRITSILLLAQPNIGKHDPVIHVDELEHLKSAADGKRALDLAILQLLAEDSRMSQTKMAKRLNMPLSTLQKRLAKIREELIDRCTVVIDPAKLGLGTYVARITTDVTRVLHVADHLRKHDCVSEVFHREDGEIIAKAICSHDAFMDVYRSLRNEFQKDIKGIVLLNQPIVCKHAPVIPQSELAPLRAQLG